jgi:hypothetical protein
MSDITSFTAQLGKLNVFSKLLCLKKHKFKLIVTHKYFIKFGYAAFLPQASPS